MKAVKILLCLVICVKTSYSTPKQVNDSPTTSNCLTKRQDDDDKDDDYSSENPTVGVPQRQGVTIKGLLLAPLDKNHSQILLVPSGNKYPSHPKPFETNMKTIKVTEKVVDINNKCNHYKPVDDFDLLLMADTWQVVYCITEEKLACFKIQIQSTTVQKRRIWSEMYGNFNGSVEWNKCIFEMIGSESDVGAVPQKNYDHRHFLQGSYNDKGLFANIIIEQYPGQNATLIQQSPDQWMVYKELLLMRDCDNGEVVVYSKMSLNKNAMTNITEIEEALTHFKEPTNTGVLACDLSNYYKFRTLS